MPGQTFTLPGASRNSQSGGPGYLASTTSSRARQTNSSLLKRPISLNAPSLPDPSTTWNIPFPPSTFKPSRTAVVNARDVARVLRTVGLPAVAPPPVPCALPPGIDPDIVLQAVASASGGQALHPSRPLQPNVVHLSSDAGVQRPPTTHSHASRPGSGKSARGSGPSRASSSRINRGAHIPSLGRRPESVQSDHLESSDVLRQFVEAFAPPTAADVEAKRQQEREQLHAKSKEWTSKWTGTLIGQRKQTLEAIETRKSAEEAARLAQDAEDDRAANERRQAIIDRARAMQLAAQEPARQAAAQALNARVQSERALQLQFSKQPSPPEPDPALISIVPTEKPVVPIAGPSAAEQAVELEHERQMAEQKAKTQLAVEQAAMTRVAQEHKLEQQVQARKHREAQLWQKHMLDKQREEQARVEHEQMIHQVEEDVVRERWADHKLQLSGQLKQVQTERRLDRVSVAGRLGAQQESEAHAARSKAEAALLEAIKKREQADMARTQEEAKRRAAAARDLHRFFQEHCQRKQTEKQTHNAIEHRLREQMLADAAKDEAERELATLTRKLQSKELAKSHREQVLEKMRREKEQKQLERETGMRCVANPVQTYSDEEMQRFLSRHFLELQQGTPLVGLPRPGRIKVLPPTNAPGGPSTSGGNKNGQGDDTVAAPARPPGSASVHKRPGTASWK